MSPNSTPKDQPLDELTEQDLREMYLQKKSKLIRYGLLAAIGVLVMTVVLIILLMPEFLQELLKNKN